MKNKPKPEPEMELPLQSFRLRNFKAVRDSGVVTFTPLTVFIGNNGSGKSSLIEGLETFRSVILKGLDEAFLHWKGFESIWNKAQSHKLVENQVGRSSPANPMGFEILGKMRSWTFDGKLEINTDGDGNRIFFTKQDLVVPFDPRSGRQQNAGPKNRVGDLMFHEFVRPWQFLNLEPSRMLQPHPQRRSISEVQLQKDGSNVAQFLQSILDVEPGVLAGIAETLKSVLPYASDLRPAITSELERNVYLKLSEKGISEPLGGWLLSQGTLRIVALLAALRHPNPPTVLFVEELENGLDPRTIHLVIEEIRSFLLSGGQVVATTHSPYLLDLLDLSQIVVVERNKSGAPTFTRPSKQKLKGWTDKFAPGRLYTMGNLTEN
jgi:predicted ATPase